MQSKSNDVSGWVEDLMRMLHMLEGDDVHSIYNLNAIASRAAELYMDFSRVYRAKSKVRGL